MRRAFSAVALATFTALTVSACSEGEVQNSSHPPASDTSPATATLQSESDAESDVGGKKAKKYVTPSGVEVECIMWTLPGWAAIEMDCDWVGAKRPPHGQGEGLSGIDRPTLGDENSAVEK